MEPQAKYHVKNEKPFHGDYFSPRKENRLRQHEASAIILGYTLGLLLGLTAIAGLYFLGSWLINFLQSL